jgi:hypothetical protein
MPLHIAAHLGDWDLCQVLLHAADDPTVRNAAGKTPAELAKERHFDEIAVKLERNDVESIDQLRSRYLMETKPKSKPAETGDYESSEYASADEVRELKRIVVGLAETVRQLSVRVDALSAGVISQPQILEPTIIHCQGCGGMRTERCDSCGGQFCRMCWTKKCHPCAYV